MTTTSTPTGPGELFSDFSIGDFAEFHVSPRELNDLIEIHGVGVQYRRAVLCPCQRTETGMARAVCKVCKGLTWTYPENKREDLVVLFHSRRPRFEDERPGWLRAGPLTALVPLGIIPERGDVLKPACEFHIVNQVLYRDVHQLDSRVLREREVAPDHVTPPVLTARARLLYEEGEIRIEHVHWISHPGTAGEHLVEAFEGSDYSVHGDEIVWSPGRGPAPGQGFSIAYRAPAAYIVLKSEPFFRSEAGQAFPYKVEMERLDRYAREDLA